MYVNIKLTEEKATVLQYRQQSYCDNIKLAEEYIPFLTLNIHRPAIRRPSEKKKISRGKRLVRMDFDKKKRGV